MGRSVSRETFCIWDLQVGVLLTEGDEVFSGDGGDDRVVGIAEIPDAIRTLRMGGADGFDPLASGGGDLPEVGGLGLGHGVSLGEVVAATL